MRILLSNIQDKKENYTRFIVLRIEKTAPIEKKKASIEHSSFVSEAESKLKSSPVSGPEFGYELGDIQENLVSNCKTLLCKTSLIIYLEKDRPGALHEILGAFAKRKINLTKIESRPSKKELGDYYFYIDFEGHVSDALIKDALEDIRAKVDTLKVLGSYPAIK